MRRTCPAVLVLALALLGPVALRPDAAAARQTVTPPPTAARPTVLLAALATTSTATRAADLRNRVDRALVGSTARSVAVAVDVAGLGAVERRTSSTSLPPASTQKLLTCLAALERLGPGRRARTALVSAAPVVGGVLRGDLVLAASGDPFFSSVQLQALATRLAGTGVRSITGRLLVDDTRYDRLRRGAGWKASWVPDESGPLSAMALDRNAWRTDSSYLQDPATPVLARLRSDLVKVGVAVGASYARAASPFGSRVLVDVYGARLADVVTRVARESDNFGAELLLKELGRVGRGPGHGTAPDGSSVVHAVLGGFGVPSGTTADGSGLSSLDRQTAVGELTLLRQVEGRSTYAPLRAALPVACRTGTLQHRLCGSATAGRVAAKTGTLDTVHSLTGWTTTADGHRVRFALLLAGFTSPTQATAAIDRAVVVLAGARTG